MNLRCILIIILIFIFSFQNFGQVTTNGNDILINGTKYKINGMCYSSIKKGENRASVFDYSFLDVDIALMKDAGINTIRIYFPLDNKQFFDKMNAAGIKVIVGFPNFDDTHQYADIHHGTYLKYIEKYKNHPAILLWELGNEYNYHPEWFNNDMKNWYTILNNAAAKVKEIDSNHPVATAHGEVPTLEVIKLCENIDVWGMNVYRWDNPSSAADEFAALSKLPFYFSEAGCDRMDNKTMQPYAQEHAKGVYNTLKYTFDNKEISGLCLFEWNDEWWKAKGSNDVQDPGGFSGGVPYDNFSNEEWYGVVDIDRNTTLAYDTLRYYYTGKYLSTTNKKGETFKIVPPITNGEVQLKFAEIIKKAKLLILDAEGKLLKKKRIKNIKNLEIDLNKLKITPNAVYYLKISDKNGKMTQRVVFVNK